MALERDQWALQVRRHLQALRQLGPAELTTTNWTYYEALAICRRAGMRTVDKMRRTVESQVAIWPVGAAQEIEALRRFFAWGDKLASVVDHANLLAAIHLGCEAILSFDEDFVPIARGTGVRVLR